MSEKTSLTDDKVAVEIKHGDGASENVSIDHDLFSHIETQAQAKGISIEEEIIAILESKLD